MNFKVSLCWNLIFFILLLTVNLFLLFIICFFSLLTHFSPILSPDFLLSYHSILYYFLLFYLKSSYFILSYSILSYLILTSFLFHLALLDFISFCPTLFCFILLYLILCYPILNFLIWSYSLPSYRIVYLHLWCIRFSVPETSGLRGKSSNPSWSRLWQKKTSTINNP